MEIWLSCLVKVENGVDGARKDKASSVLVFAVKEPGWFEVSHSLADCLWPGSVYGNHTQLQPLIFISRVKSCVDPIEVNLWLWSSIMVDTV